MSQQSTHLLPSIPVSPRSNIHLTDTDYLDKGCQDIIIDKSANPDNVGRVESDRCVSGEIIASMFASFSRSGLDFCLKVYKEAGCHDGDMVGNAVWTCQSVLHFVFKTLTP